MTQAEQTSLGSSTRTRAEALRRVLVHPLLLLVVGGLISALLATTLTQRWQEQQRALDVQTTLVAEMTEASENMLLALARGRDEIADSNVNPPHPKVSASGFTKRTPAAASAIAKLDGAQREWLVRHAVIGSRLRAYYRGGSIPAEWDQLDHQLEDLYDATLLLAAPSADDDEEHAVADRLSKRLQIKENLVTEQGFRFEKAAEYVGLFRDKVVQSVLDQTPTI
jgi:hypothetical protein